MVLGSAAVVSFGAPASCSSLIIKVGCTDARHITAPAKPIHIEWLLVRWRLNACALPKLQTFHRTAAS